jgi:hypothetical protein
MSGNHPRRAESTTRPTSGLAALTTDVLYYTTDFLEDEELKRLSERSNLLRRPGVLLGRHERYRIHPERIHRR